jgi:N-acetylglucosamine kinase-like BadF-type ATPase
VSDGKGLPLPVADVVGIDVGGTKTHIRGLRNGTVVADRVVPSDDWRGSSIFPTVESMTALAAVVIELVQVSSDTSIAAGIHGCDTPLLLEIAHVTLTRELGVPVLVVNDAELLGHAAGQPDSIQVIAGTGAIVLGRAADGTAVTADGYSWILGDSGSAAAIVREALRSTLDAHDAGTLGADPLFPALLSAFSSVDASSLATAATELAGASSWGKHSRRVFDAADIGSTIANRVISTASNKLAEGVASVLRRGAVASAIVAAGGVIVGQPRMQVAVRDRLAELEVALPFEILHEPPVVGAVRLATSRGMALPRP